MSSENSNGYPCPACGGMIWSGTVHSCASARLMGQWCPLCGGIYVGSHACTRATLPSFGHDRLTCLHCWCAEDGPGDRVVGGQVIVVNKRHEVCCTCGSRRVIAEESDRDPSPSRAPAGSAFKHRS